MRNTFKIAFQYLFKVVILSKTVFYLKLNFILKINPKTCTFENLEEISQKPFATLLQSDFHFTSKKVNLLTKHIWYVICRSTLGCIEKAVDNFKFNELLILSSVNTSLDKQEVHSAVMLTFSHKDEERLIPILPLVLL